MRDKLGMFRWREFYLYFLSNSIASFFSLGEQNWNQLVLANEMNDAKNPLRILWDIEEEKKTINLETLGE